MGTLIPELNCVIHRILMIAPCRSSLADLESKFRERLSYLIQEDRATFKSFQLPEGGAWRSWTSFDLGKRGRLRFRFMLVGVVSKEYLPSIDLWESFDSFLWAAPVESLESEEILRIKVPVAVQAKPCIVWGLQNELSEDEQLRAKALKNWYITNFSQRYYLKHFSPEEFSNALEWALSFAR